MLAQKLAARRRGFTLIELLIVIVVIAILALIVIPRLMNAGDRARSATYHDNINQISKALEVFHNDMGCYPATGDLTDLGANTIGTVVTPTTTAGFTASNFHGPYLTSANGIGGSGLPLNPYVVSSDTTVADHWTYAAVAATGTSPATYTLAGTVLPPSGY